MTFSTIFSIKLTTSIIVLNHPKKKCSCSPYQVQRYLAKISGPLLDRIDLHIEVAPVSFSDLASTTQEESSHTIKNRVQQTREIQSKRYAYKKVNRCNSNMSKSEMKRFCQLTQNSSELIEKAMNKLNLSARAYDRILKIARTIADMDQKENIQYENKWPYKGNSKLFVDIWFSSSPQNIPKRFKIQTPIGGIAGKLVVK